MEHPQPRAGEILERVLGRDQLARERDGDRVDGEVAAVEVLLERRRRHLGERAGRRVALAAGHRDVDAPALAGRGRGPEGIVDGELAAERARERRRIALDDEIQLARGKPERDVAHEAADHRDAAGCLIDRRVARQRGENGARDDRSGAHHCRTATPAAARCALACATVNWS